MRVVTHTHIPKEYAVGNLRRGLPIGRRTDGRTIVIVKFATREHGVAVHAIDSGTLLFTTEILEMALK